MSSNLQNSIWPNTDGNLGNIKVQIPDGVTTPWPTGDALINNFVYHKGKLVGLVDTKALIANSSKSTTFPYEYVNISLPSIAEGEMTYNHDQCIYFILNGKVIKGDVPTDEEFEIITKKYAGCKTVADVIAVDPDFENTDIVGGDWKEGLADLENGGYMFMYCEALASFFSDLSNLTGGKFMFRGCTNLETFSADLPSLTDGRSMFQGCYSLTEFLFDLPSLTDGTEMFKGTNLTSFTSNLPSLQNGSNMFQGCYNLETFSSDLSSLESGSYMFPNCYKLESFISDLHNLTNGDCMFQGCDNLTLFSSNLSSLQNGNYMFENCKLDTASVQNIADTINDVNGLIDSCSDGIWTIINIGIGNSEPNSQEETAFNTMVSKGWTVYVNGSGFGSSCCASCCASCSDCSSCASCCATCYDCSCEATCCASLATLDETDGEFVAPKPYWAKPIPSDEEHAQYVDSEGNFYNILGAQFIYGDNLETYGMFTSLEDAAANMRLKKIGEVEIETA